MAQSRFTFTDRARPVVELGVGDTRVDVGTGRWGESRWDDPAATWAGDEPYWLDISCDVVETTIDAGRQRSTDRFNPATASIVALNATGWADLVKPAVPPALLELRPGRALRVGVEHTEYGRVWLWRGYIDAVTPRYEPGDIDTVIIDAICALGEVGRGDLARLSAGVGAGEAGSARINRILDAAAWSKRRRDIAETGVALVATTMGRQTADLLAVTTESVGGAVFGDRSGRVAFRGRDWQTFAPATPVDGVIGNTGDAGAACPSAWDRSSRRVDVVTRCVLARDTDTASTVYDDTEGQSLYGLETFKATDLVCQDTAQLARLAQRQFRTRGHQTLPRVERVRLDGAIGDATLDVMTTVDVFKPSRYRCVLDLPRGEVFDLEMFATGVRHYITGEVWECEIDLDVAAPWQAPNARWDQAYWGSAHWSGAVTATGGN